MELSSKLKELRKLRNWTQRDLAYFSGVSLDSIRGYEINKTTNITKKNLQKIASAFGISETDFYFNNLSVSENEKMSVSDKNLSVSGNKMSVSQTKLKEAEKESFYYIPKLNISASAGGGNELEGLECYESGELMAIDKAFFKTIPSSSIKAIRVDGYSMTPMLFPDSWVIFEESADFKGDGLYVLNYNGQLMVKLLQLNPFENILEIISVNKEYKSYSIKLDESQTPLFIKGKVLRSVI
ncbi:MULTISPECIES: XRE family transcriptional regulator [Campylobacter]|uniref:LexA family transcriptional regulator n=1 Tax=Campylobacter jejuni TaxID=197 RepID=A0A624F4L3_CAMJU|nr:MULTISPECIES: LexA family transcriptional regulator [Campylobacter]ECZ5737794.1 LexA family transcriptional regulator [Campylobacter jejuni]EDA5833316.1 LexA family transcriptional regulator [Campylobacter jejuni]EKG1205377.1 LexA family transcriptional regulator [Campylobacter jejuni]PCH30987.1 helix-turn-helix domain-containing protein [Campylobacter sp. 113]HDZ4291978.1 LexA family transcriptional regulator [Campylobacter jejuni]